MLRLVEPEAAVSAVQSAVSTAELNRRPSRRPDHASENRALIELATEMAVSPDGILQKLADTALGMCRAHSAGLSLLEDGDQKRNFHWRTVAGVWARHRGGGTPRDFGPCGTVPDRNVPLLFSHPDATVPYFGEVEPLLEEGLLVPFHIKGEAVGTIWVVAHDESCRFDAEDLRVLTNLATFAAAGYQTLLFLNAARSIESIVESSGDAIVSTNLDGVIATWNQGATRLFGYLPEEIIGKSIAVLIPPDRADEGRMISERVERGDRVAHYETIRQRKDKSLVPISLTISSTRNNSGEIVGASNIARDISERKQREEHIALLSREAGHRSKNLLTLVQATVRLARGDTARALKAAIDGRIQALANVHALLELSHWVGADIRKLVEEELCPYCVGSESRTDIVGPSLLLKPKSAQSIAIVLHELTTNAVKYGALSWSAGRVRVSWSHALDGRLGIVWTESNGPRVEPPSRSGLGTTVIEQIVTGDLNGHVRFDWRAEGLVCTLTLDPDVES